MKPVTLILAGGGARGLCFVGALRALATCEIPVSRIIAVSMGAIIGGTYSSGVPLDEMDRLARALRLRDFLRLGPRSQGVFSHVGIHRLVRRFLAVDTFEALQIPLTVICTDLQKGESVSYTSGPLTPPVVGSCLTAGVFEPLLFENRYLVDGGYTEPVPVRTAASGDLIVTIDPTVRPDWNLPLRPGRSLRNLFSLRLAYLQMLKSVDTMLYGLSREHLDGREHVHVVPEMDGVKFTDFQRADDVIKAGETALMKMAPEIRRRLGA